MKRLLVFPTWYLVNAITPFLPAWHPWRGRWFTLQDWAKGATPLTEELSFMLWFTVALTVIVILETYG